ncbi:fluoride efflux transporter CrcB [Gallaecimonas sp. GXIMD4217]|uniref:fluoride efflux transporter CrcB n=1 Tax=Gallaecimonas sp. GXIMD4217 TaxID=3131927 RepID=UPI00311B3FB8
MQSIFYVALGGALGALARFGVNELSLWLFGRHFPVGTLLVNLVGSFLMGLLMGLVLAGHVQIQPWKQFIGLGFLGAFTTFSTFAMDNVLLLEQGEYLKAGLYIGLNLVLSILLAFSGMALVRNHL